MLLKGKTAIVTGGSRGIGHAILEMLSNEGANVVFTYKKSRERAEALVREYEEMNRKVIGIQSDVCSLKDAKKIVSLAEETFGTVDILINNAGITGDKPLMVLTQEEWQNVVDVNLTGVFNYTKAVIVRMLKQKSGDIINISSYSGVFGSKGQCNYSATKAGMIGFAKSLSKEVGAYNIRVNTVAPGFIETEMLDQLSKKYKKKILDSIALRRFGTPQEVAGTVKFLLSEDSKYITGQVILIDGGLVL